MAVTTNGVPDAAVPPPVAFTYRTYRLDPTSPNLQFLIGKFSALSLRALTTDPESFGMAYLTEASFSPADWTRRITRPNVHIFVCVAHPADLPEEWLAIENGDWVGMVTQIGPTPKETYWFKEAGAPEPLGDREETKCHQTATWIDPAHRGRRLAKKIVEAGVNYARESIVGEVRQARIRAITGPTNEVSKGLYGSRGFPVVGACTINEAMGANGNAEYGFHGRQDWPVEMMMSRQGAVMERVVRKGE